MPTATEDITDSTTRNFTPKTDLPSAHQAQNGGYDSIRSDRSLDNDPLTLNLETSSQANGTVGNNHHHPANGYGRTSPSSSSSSQLSGEFAEDDDYYSNCGGRYRRNRGASSQSSISSLPDSVVVYPRGKSNNLPFLAHHDDTYAGSRRPTGRTPSKFAPRVRDRNSPFRHPSSVRAMQMGDEEDDYGEDVEWGTLTPSSNRRWMQDKAFAQSPSYSEISVDSKRTGRGSPYLQRQHRSSPHGMSPHQQLPQEQAPEEYPLILLHCTLLPPSLSLPPGLGTPSAQLLKDALPPQYWQRWKLLEDKLGGSGVLRERGVLISHPQDAYDLLEERLLESLELVRPRLAYGHFLGPEDEDTDETGTQCRDEDSTETANGINGHTCADCGNAVVGSERKWDVRVYAANGLMKAGAWEAAWKGMEKIDVEVGVYLPADVRQDLERRILEENEIKVEVERQMADESRRREIYGESMGPTQDDIDALMDDNNDNIPCAPDPPADGPPHDEVQTQVESSDVQQVSQEVNLRVALLNYVRLLANDPRNAALVFMAMLVAFLAMRVVNPGVSSDLTVPQSIHPQPSPFSSLGQHSPPPTATVTSAFTPPSSSHPVVSAGDSEPSMPAGPPSFSSANKAEFIQSLSSGPSQAAEPSPMPPPPASEPQSSDGPEDASTPEAPEPEFTIAADVPESEFTAAAEAAESEPEIGMTPSSPLIPAFEKEQSPLSCNEL